MKTCTVDDCQKKHTAKGMCQMHYRRNKLYNDPKLRPGRPRRNTASINNNGYELLYEPENPNANVNGLVLVHRKVMSEVLGRPLLRIEQVHHKNGNRSDNRIENLEIWTTHQPQGQRIEDKIEYAIEILKQYAPHLLMEKQ
jgi:hypothetical protein